VTSGAVLGVPQAMLGRRWDRRRASPPNRMARIRRAPVDCRDVCCGAAALLRRGVPG
jgi:hypothetical protein